MSLLLTCKRCDGQFAEVAKLVDHQCQRDLYDRAHPFLIYANGRTRRSVGTPVVERRKLRRPEGARTDCR